MDNGFAADASINVEASEKSTIPELGSAPGSTRHRLETSTASFVQPPAEVLKEVNRCVAREIDLREARVETRAQEAKNVLRECDRERESLRAKKALIQEAERLQLEILNGAPGTRASTGPIITAQSSSPDNDQAIVGRDLANSAEPEGKRSFPAALFASRVRTRM